jgi:cobalamin biosynthesis Co2+ chelatase CbiK
MGNELSKQVERNVKVYDCQNKMVDGHRAFYMVADDYWQGQKSIQYMIPKNNDEILLFTAGSRMRNFDDMQGEFEKVMASLKID